MKRVAEVKITIENCNNISKGVISLEEEKLNIRYGMNGTGKSTLSTAISLFSQGKPMDDLKPFGSDDEIIPAISIDGDIQGVRVFNEDFVNNMVFKESTVIDNAFDVFIRTTDYEQKRQNLDNRLLRLKVDIDEKQPIIQLKNDIAAFAGKLELNAAGEKIKNNTNYKAIIKKNNVYNIPDRLKKYSPIISDDQICINWIDWKSRGETFDTKGICPYCSDELNAGFAEEKQTFKETYKKSDAQNLKNMLDLFENFHKYIPDDKFDSIIACIKEEKEESAISAILKTFMNEYVHISTQLNKISYFDKNVFKKININDIDKVLEDMKFEKSIFNFFSSDGFYEIVDEVNNSIEELRKEAIDIKVAMGKLQSVLIRVVAAVIRAVNNKNKPVIFATQRGYGEFKGGWEFPGGKIESGETPQQALKREIMEELDTEIAVGELIDTIEYDYPNFHLSMDCFWCEVIHGELILNEAEDAKWLTMEHLADVKWLPADVTLIEKIGEALYETKDSK